MIYADRKSFGMRLYAAVDEAGLSYRDICEELQIAPQTYYGWLDGRFLPRIDVAICLAEMLNVDVKWLAYGEGK